MARTRITLRVKKDPPMIPTEIDTPAPAAADSPTAVTENNSVIGYAQAPTLTHSSDTDSSVGDTKKSAKRTFNMADDDAEMQNVSDTKPVILEQEEEIEENSDDDGEEVVYLGTVKPHAITRLAAKGNSNQNAPMTYCIGNVNFGKAHGHFMMISNGFDQNGSPRHSFRNYLLELFVKNGK